MKDSIRALAADHNEFSDGAIPPEKPYRTCASCRKVKSCKWIDSMITVESQWNEKHGDDIPFPFKPILLAQDCNEYESPLDVIKIDHKTKEIATQ